MNTAIQFTKATYVLITGAGDIHSRIMKAVSFLMDIQDQDIPNEMLHDWDKIKRIFSKIDPKSENLSEAADRIYEISQYLIRQKRG